MRKNRDVFVVPLFANKSNKIERPVNFPDRILNQWCIKANQMVGKGKPMKFYSFGRLFRAVAICAIQHNMHKFFIEHPINGCKYSFSSQFRRAMFFWFAYSYIFNLF